MNNGTMKMRGAEISASTFMICGDCFQNDARTSPKIFRRRSSAACCKTGAAESSFSVVPWPRTTSAAAEKSSLCTRPILPEPRLPASRLMHIFSETF